MNRGQTINNSSGMPSTRDGMSPETIARMHTKHRRGKGETGLSDARTADIVVIANTKIRKP